ncbi:MAG: hypothetical protein H0V01_15565 [Bacteroidetes bacterium]|nr:hypothetical protein [Bacteroidota bacterium]HET6244883.1 hypothetical protein [Bacteroidia bacterium]
MNNDKKTRLFLAIPLDLKTLELIQAFGKKHPEIDGLKWVYTSLLSKVFKYYLRLFYLILNYLN